MQWRDNRPEVLREVMRMVVRGEIDRDKIPELSTITQRVHAAIAYMNLHRAEFLDEQGAVKGQFRRVLVDLIGVQMSHGSANVAARISARAGLHRSEFLKGTGSRGVPPKWITWITPLDKLGL